MRRPRHASLPFPTSLPSPHQDKTAYAIHFLAGAAILAPWNSVLTAGDYFEASLPGIPVTRLVTAAYLPPTLLFALALLGRHDSTRPRARVITSFVAFIILLVLLPVLDKLLGCPALRRSCPLRLASAFSMASANPPCTVKPPSSLAPTPRPWWRGRRRRGW